MSHKPSESNTCSQINNANSMPEFATQIGCIAILMAPYETKSTYFQWNTRIKR
ncbi:hypothetical protein SESBI_03390 [Sesbania bispinosa]|nr:hypothetical protein SESBI_03390 [Sesbania bispinosa]